MALNIIKKLTQLGKKFKPKKKFSQNIGTGKIKQDKLYKSLGTDKYGDIQIVTKGPQKGYRVPLEKKGFTERRPWSSDPDYKPSYGERLPTGQYGATVKKQMKQFEEKAAGGLIKGLPKLARKGWK